jgi:hypothetical protein
MTLLYILVILNLIWLFLITRAIYIKNKSKPQSSSLTNINDSFKLNITRFNPFDDMGGNQSFILTLLDHTNSGVVLTSLHNRDVTRLYAKSIKNGEGDNVTLSKDEKLAIVKTIKG